MLPLAQVGAHVQDAVTRGERPESRQLVEQDGGHRTRAGAEFENLAAAKRRQYFGALARDATAEHRRDLGRRDEVARGAQLSRPCAVVAEPGLVQRELHERREADPAAARVDLAPDPILERPAVRGLLRS